MKYQHVKDLEGDLFRRLTGIRRETFVKISEILKAALERKHARGGRTPRLAIEDMLLMTLEYLREYRTYFHMSQSYEVSESTAYKVVPPWLKIR